ncbi:hypothetical protein [Sorangium cellulosum]|uniref:Uncharacterized protein n=1 Tax=Sorangium cellulosum TaxID=56 RepID=A0A150QIQ7_SORCE|nr:hypothetical protein [Sorangium cellulosum]KYF67823.1 hypothetical protein BE15_12765 [Sorangium cellulosum]
MLLNIDLPPEAPPPSAAPDPAASPRREGRGDAPPAEPAEPAEQRSSAAPRPPLVGMPVLALIRPLAVLALLAMVLGRMLAPAMVGLAVGIERTAHAVELAGAGASQLFAIGAIVMAMALISAVVRSRVPYALRIAAIVAGSFVILVVLHATVQRVPDLSAALIGVSAAILALGSAWEALRVPFMRPVAAALGLVGASALVRLTGVLLAVWANERGSKALAGATSSVATAAFALDALAVLTATVALGAGRDARSRGAEQPRPGPRLVSPLSLAALAAALLATRAALAGAAEDASMVETLFRRALDRLLTRPAPVVPLSMQVFVAALSVAVVALALIAPPRLPALGGALALLLVARSAPEVPLGALSLVIAALCVALASRDERGFWASVLATERERAPSALPGAGNRTPPGPTGGASG